METAMIVLGLLALAGMGAMVCACVFLGRTIVKMGNQLTANSGHQLERIKLESGAEAVGRYVGAVRSHVPDSGYERNEPVPDFVAPHVREG